MNRFSGSAPVDIPCSCHAHLPRYPLIDARGIFCTYVCEACEEAKRAEYRPDIFTDPDYWHDEPIDGDDW